MFSLSLSWRDKLAGHMLWVGALGAGTLLGTQDAQAQFTLPSGLSAGSTYRLVFLTSGATAATSTDISTYNSFVTAQAALNSSLPSTNWYAIASTATTSAAANIGCGGSCGTDPVYLVNGTEVVASAANLFAATPTGWITLLSAINVFQNGQTDINPDYAWTGSLNDGSAAAALGSNFVSEGWSVVSDNGYLSSGFTDSNTTPLEMYAISGELTVPAAVPEPGSMPLMASGILLAAGLGWRRHARKSV